MSVVAFLTDTFATRKILDHLGLSTPEAEKPRRHARSCGRRARARAGECPRSGSNPRIPTPLPPRAPAA